MTLRRYGRQGMKSIVLAAIVLSATPVLISAQETTDAALVVWHPVLADSVQRLDNESPAFRDALRAVAVTGRRTILTTPDRIKNSDVDVTSLAQAIPVTEGGSRVDTVIVVINLELMQKLTGLPVKAIDFEDDLDRIIAHEVYGHAVPYLLAGNLSGKCADPAAGQSAADACAIRRENIVRKEMKLGQRFDYGRSGLALARRYRQ
jgi:hypothetical protein